METKAQSGPGTVPRPQGEREAEPIERMCALSAGHLQGWGGRGNCEEEQSDGKSWCHADVTIQLGSRAKRAK